jgi:hypothetical protein
MEKSELTTSLGLGVRFVCRCGKEAPARRERNYKDCPVRPDGEHLFEQVRAPG